MWGWRGPHAARRGAAAAASLSVHAHDEEEEEEGQTVIWHLNRRGSLSLQEGAPGHAQVVGRGQVWRRPAAAPVDLHVVPQVGLGGEALVAVLAGERLLLGVDPPVADQLRGNPERLAAVGTLVAFGFGVNAPVVLQGHEVGELLLAGGAEEGPSLVAVLVVEERAGVAVGPPALVAHMGLGDIAAALSAASFGQAAGVESLLLHQGVVQA